MGSKLKVKIFTSSSSNNNNNKKYLKWKVTLSKKVVIFNNAWIYEIKTITKSRNIYSKFKFYKKLI